MPILQPKYDHFTSPGAVPRTFIGSILVIDSHHSLLALVRVVPTKFELQIIIRLVVSSLTALSLILLRHRLPPLQPPHLPILHPPNMFPVPFAFLDSIHPPNALLRHLPRRTLPPPRTVSPSLPPRASYHSWEPGEDRVGAGVLSIVLIDTHFWKKKTEYPLWPEFFGAHFNVVQVKSAEWGVRPSSLSPFPSSPPTPPHLPPPIDLPTPNIPLRTPPKSPPPHPPHIRPHPPPIMVFVGI
ncbi:hypothetical protein K443DRAFT_12721 [Laccaria amethystina LaAM-08-1]|uniref:Unplaced genomic scaffold K443scaffold_298, whole genome shotgun sequence n=1 Tax=Laccaria amethystina LaAM-08-1 TaxID=1095629 RepID=A0A0C9WQV7_9AGAR|nr:hypothetical protein K443DRAFT_12721 [Laccaria amethystina LaAM-08-1]